MPANVVGLHQMHPPGCQCGCGANWGCDSPGWGQDLMQCWDQINQLKCLIKQIMDEVGGPVRTGPIKGVIDGSNAKPGEVGEVVFSQQSGNFPNTLLQQTITAAILQPGDWDVQIFVQLVGAWTTGAYMQLSPLPTGVLSDMRMVVGAADPTAVSNVETSLLGPVTQASVSVPTLLPLLLSTNINGTSTGQPTGAFICQTFARRMR